MPKTELAISNYCIGFVDLLGQRNALKGEELVPVMETPEEHQAFIDKVKRSVGQIEALQRSADALLKPLLNADPNSRFRNALSKEERKIWDLSQKTNLKQQRWSDGLVLFHSLHKGVVDCPMNGVYAVMTTCACLCLMGIAGGQPIRGAVDVAWAIELNEGEIYGAAVARAYELESEVAQYPRIVVSSRFVGYLDAVIREAGESKFDQINKDLALLCRSFLIADIDGHYILHYLGEPFILQITKESHDSLYKNALLKIQSELRAFKETRNTKLAIRYEMLQRYFLAFAPKQK